MYFFRRVYGLLLNLYPKDFLDEFREELQTVFDLSLREAAREGVLKVVVFIIRELIGLPKAALYEHLRQRRRDGMIQRFGARFDFAPGSTRESLAALTPLLLLMVLLGILSTLYSAFDNLPRWLLKASVYFFIALFFILLVVGLVRRIPRWTMPYMGLLLAFFSLYKFSELMYAYYGRYSWHVNIWLWDELITQIYLWSGITLAVFLLVIACAIFPAFQKFRRDWTVLSFLVYGAAPIAILLTFDEYRKAEPSQMSIFFLLAVGMWYYLHTSGKWKRFLILFSSLTISLWIGAVSRAILIPYQTWAYGYQLNWGHEMTSPIPMWVWLTFTMLLPSVISLLPQVRRPVVMDSSN